MNNCDFILEDIISITAYEKNDITFIVPVSLARRTISNSDYDIDSGSGFKILFDEDKTPTVKEKSGNTRGGDYRTVSVSWESENINKSVVEQYERLQADYHHFVFTRLDGRKYMLRTDELCYDFSYVYEGSALQASLSHSSETGLQFME